MSSKIGNWIIFKEIMQDPALLRAESIFAAIGNFSPATWLSLQTELLNKVDTNQKLCKSGMGEVTLWQNHIISLIASSRNVFSLRAEAVDSVESTPLFDLAAAELKYLQELYHYNFKGAAIDSNAAEIRIAADTVVLWETTIAPHITRMRIKDAMEAPTGAEAAKILADSYRKFGVGDINKYDAFVWDEELIGVSNIDPIKFDDLIGYEHQKCELIQNTELLLAGLPARNMLLYGDSGTGKSSSIKALLNKYKSDGLKLISLSREKIDRLPELLKTVESKAQKFIVFVDDLSFEECDSSYKSFKSIIEGSVRRRPINTLICVTSNRRNIVKEVWKDREGVDDIHLRDNLQEKRSLADRFGLTLVYPSPDKQEYIGIVLALSKKVGINTPDDELIKEALTWEIRQGGRSGRAARQFIDYKSATANPEGNSI
jgi:predicted AAA+ superfamily ATPase